MSFLKNARYKLYLYRQKRKLDKSGIKYGKNLKLYNASLDYTFGPFITIGDDVCLTNCVILAHDASLRVGVESTRVGVVEIGNRVFIGYHAIILPNTRIGNDVIIGAGSIVSGDIPDNSVIYARGGAQAHGKTSDLIARHEAQMTEERVIRSWSKKTTAEKQAFVENLRDADGNPISGYTR